MIFEVTQEADDGFVAECFAKTIIIQVDDWFSLKVAVTEAVRGFCFDESHQAACHIRLHLVCDEAFTLA